MSHFTKLGLLVPLLLLLSMLPAAHVAAQSPIRPDEPSPEAPEQGISEPDATDQEKAASRCAWASGFHSYGANSAVRESVFFDDGTGMALYAVGDFVAMDGVRVDHVAKWDGSSWTAMGGGMNALVWRVVVFDDGNGPALYVGGDFTTAGGVPINRVAKWSGTQWLPLGNGVNGSVRSMTVFDDGTGAALYIGGQFTQSGSEDVKRIAKWNGTSWVEVGGGADKEVSVFLSWNDGSGSALYIGGNFSMVGSVAASRIAKWDGSSWYPVGSGFDGWVGGLATYNDGSGEFLHAAGSFLNSGGAPMKRLAKWNGSTWSEVGGGVNGSVFGLVKYNDASGPGLLLTGDFTTAGETVALRIARWNGSNWSTFGSGFNGWTTRPTVYDDGNGPVIYLGGPFAIPTRFFAKWDGMAWSPIVGSESANGLSYLAVAMKVFNDGSGPALFVGGDFTEASNVTVRSVAKWDGTSWSPLGTGISYGVVTAFEIFDDGSGPALYMGGYFETVDGIPVSHIAKWNGVSWSALGSGTNDMVWGLKTFDDGSGPALYVGGDFTVAGGISVGRVAKWNGSTWSAVGTGTGMNKRVRSLEIFDAGIGERLFAGGSFTEVDGQAAGYMASWTGSTWQPITTGLDNIVYVQKPLDFGSGKELYVGGLFTTVAGLTANRIAKWNGSTWSTVGAVGANDGVAAIEKFDDGTGPGLYLGGTFGSVDGVPAARIAKFQGGRWSAVDSSVIPVGVNWVHAFAVFDDGSGPSLYTGGLFPLIGSVVSSNFAKYACVPAADLAVSKSDGVTTTSPGSSLTYTLLASNIGSAADPAAVLTDTLPADLTCSYSSVASGGATGNTASGTGSLSETLNLPAGSAVTYTLSCTVAASAIGTLTNSVTLAASVYDANTANNSASDSDTLLPLIRVPASTVVTEGGAVEIPVELLPAGLSLAGISASLDYDQTCLTPDADNNGILDQVTWSVPAGFSTVAVFNPLDTDGEIDLSIVDISPPIDPLPAGLLVKIKLQAICAVPGAEVAAPVVFSTAPAPTFGDILANNVVGAWAGGVVRILGGPAGDCNSDNLITIADLTAIGLEIFDGDGEFWLDAPQPTYPGSPVGCDANASTLIQAADVSCANLLLFGGTCSTRTEQGVVTAPVLEVSTQFEAPLVWLRARLQKNGSAVASLAFSFDLDPTRFDLTQVDLNHDGRIDHVRFPQGQPGLAMVSWNPGDPDGEMDFLLADLSQRSLAEGILVEVGIPATQPQSRGVVLSAAPAPTFGSTTGGDLPGISVEGLLLFTDGFESGGTERWSSSSP